MTEPAHRRDRRTLLLSILVLATLFGCCGGCIPLLRWANSRTAIVSPSPSGRYEIQLREQRFRFIDRNFRLFLRDKSKELMSREIFLSPDEGLPEGTERFIWSSDDRYVLLVGRHFFVANPSLVTSAGESAYLLIDVESGQQWTNIKQAIPDSPLTAEVLDDLLPGSL